MDWDHQDAERACKRIRLQSPEPDVAYDNFEDFLLSDTGLFRQITRDNDFFANSLETIGEDKGEAKLGIVDNTLIAETVHHVCLGMCGGIMKLSTANKGAYAGIVTDSFPSELLQRPSVKLSALLTAPASLRVIILSHIEEAAEIGGILSNNDLFLQHPSPREIEYFELEMEYFNPHYLVTPRSCMPQLEDLAIEDKDSSSNIALALDEQKKGQLIGLFDTAADLSIRPTTEPSPRLQTRLKDYQPKALTVMSEKECANVENPQCPSLWVARDTSNGKDRTDVVSLCAGGILADEMGLGKTLCVLSLICWSLDLLRDTEAQKNGSEPPATLVVIPKSSQFSADVAPVPSLIVRVAIYHGPGRQSLAEQFRNNDIVLTTYQTLRSEWINKGPLYTEQWFRVVLDEGEYWYLITSLIWLMNAAHRIGNRSTQIFQAVCELQSPRRWCLTGTPIVNSIDNYGALLAFIKMEPLDAKAIFDHWISNPIRDNGKEGLRKLRMLVEATCLRRTKSSISQALPPPTVCEERVDLHPYDRALYDFFESEAAKNALNLSNGYSTNRIANSVTEKKNVLSLIQNLRLICDHGEDLLPDADIEAWSVVFSYWTKMLDLIQQALLVASFSCVRIDGQFSIKKREEALFRFANDPCCTVMLATLGSGGEGIDLTSANHVHLLEPHWNPMAEEQAIARVHRIGQQRHVTATKYITPDSIEEKW
ncbi:helicase-like transcription factor [Fusarium circinatum]|uniref:Helicase-like transcription factor n=1 Tax=Fusarium circinatum TaxID=48490 RepID=A0A8H5WT92_FUSCI|nr:helicase-like transcription factor [Fusarium circinatum]